MFLQDVLQPEFIKVDLEAEDKYEAFKELVDYYCRIGKSNSRKEILEAITAREAKMSTGIYRGIAVPHGRTSAVNKLCGVLGISKKGIHYDSLDGEPVYLIFMIISPMEDGEKHLRLLKHLADLIENQQFQVELLSQTDSKSAFDIICKYETMGSV